MLAALGTFALTVAPPFAITLMLSNLLQATPPATDNSAMPQSVASQGRQGYDHRHGQPRHSNGGETALHFGKLGYVVKQAGCIITDRDNRKSLNSALKTELQSRPPIQGRENIAALAVHRSINSGTNQAIRQRSLLSNLL